MPAEIAYPTEGREVVGVFHDAGRFRAAVDELFDRTFSRDQVSVLARQDVLGEHDAEELADRPDAPREGYVEQESRGAAVGGAVAGLTYVGVVGAAGVAFAIGGPVGVAALAGAATGATVGGILSNAVAKRYSSYYEEAVEQGGIVCWVRTRTAEEEEAASSVLRKHGAEHVHAHDLAYPKKGRDVEEHEPGDGGAVTEPRGPAR